MFVDTATRYGNEHFIGEVLGNAKLLHELDLKRDDLFITTKVAPTEVAREATRDSVLSSLEKLKLDYLDLVLIHWPGAAGAQPDSPRHADLRTKSWRALEELHREGKVKSIGVSNYTTKHLGELFALCAIKPAVNQVEFHPLCFQKDLLEFCAANQVVLQAYSSLGSAEGYQQLTELPLVKQIADRNKTSVPRVLLKWALNHQVPIIPKTSKVDRLRENFELDSVELTAEEMRSLDELNQDKHFCWNPYTIA